MTDPRLLTADERAAMQAEAERVGQGPHGAMTGTALVPILRRALASDAVREARVAELEAALHELLLFARGNPHVLGLIHKALEGRHHA